MSSKQLISRNIEVFYTKASEETRLDKGMGVFEFERIKSLININKKDKNKLMHFTLSMEKLK